jgi:prolycopene isomerase
MNPTSSEASTVTFGTEPSRDAYDVVVVGGGIGGLSAAAFLAYAGRSVLLVERLDALGGYAHAFRRGPYTFDPAVHVFGDAEPEGLPPALFRLLGVEKMIDFIQVSPYYKAVFPGVRIDAPVGLEPFIEEHQRLFPGERENIDRYFRMCIQVHREAHALPPVMGLDRLDEAAANFPVLFKYIHSTIAEAAEEYLADPRLRALGTALWPYIGTPPSEGSLVTFATHLSVLMEGAYYFRGSAQTMVDALATAVVQHGGEIVIERSVERIELEQGRVAGVTITGGDRVTAPTVVSAIAAPTTFEQLVSLDDLPSGFVRRHKRMRPGISAVILFAGTSLDLEAMGAAHENFISLHDDPEDTRRDILAGKPGGMWITVPTTADTSLAPAGEHAITITSFARHDAETWKSDLEGYQDQMLGACELLFPGLRGSITFLESAVPTTMERFTGNTNGACYGWDNTPAQTGGRRSPHLAPIEGLYLAGHWTQPGSGTMRTLVSGFHTAQMILQATGADRIEFVHSTMPPAT